MKKSGKNKIKLFIILATFIVIESICYAGMFDIFKKKENKKNSKILTDISFPLKEKVEINMIIQSSPLAPENPNDKLIFKRLEDETNVHINWRNYTWDQYPEKRKLLLASGELPAAFFDAGFSDEEILKYSQDGTIIPLEELIEKYMPNLKKILKKHPEYRSFMTAPDGHIYSLPWIEELGSGKESIHSVDCLPWINKKWLDKLGLKMPRTTDELEKVLIAFKTQDPNGNGKNDEIPMSFIINGGGEDLASIFGSFGYGDNWDHTIVTNDKKVLYTLTQEGYKKGIKWLHKLMKEGLLDKEGFSQDWSTYVSKGSQDRYGMFFTWDSGNIVPFSEGDYSQPDKIKSNFVPLPPLAGPKGHINVTRTNGFGLDRGKFVITYKAKNLELIAKWIDLAYRPLQSIQNNWGTYGNTNMQNIFELTNGKLKHLPLEKTSPWELRQKTYVAGPLAVLDEYYGNFVTKPDDAAYRLNILKQIYVPHMQSDYNFPKVFYTKDEMEKILIFDTDIKTYAEKKRAEWIWKGGIDKEWNEYLKTLNTMGLREAMKVKQEAFDRYYKK